MWLWCAHVLFKHEQSEVWSVERPPRMPFVPHGSGCWRLSASAISHICNFPRESNLSVKAWRGEAAALAPFGQHTRKKHVHAHTCTCTHTRAHAHTHLENSNFPGAEVCGIKPEPLWRKLRYSPSALRSVQAIIAASTSTHIQMGFTTWQRVQCGLRSTRVWVGSCFISSTLSSFSYPTQTQLVLWW